jgi:hypothetical protein
MKRLLLSATLLLSAMSMAHADTFDLNLGIVGLYLAPDQTIDFITAVEMLVWSENVENLYALDIDGFTFTSPDTDDQDDPIPLNQVMSSN